MAILKELNHHSHIIKLIDYMYDDENCYIITELCDHGSLRERIYNMFSE